MDESTHELAGGRSGRGRADVGMMRRGARSAVWPRHREDGGAVGARRGGVDAAGWS